MATVKFILDCRAVKVGGAAPLKISIGHQRKTALLPLNISLTPEQWNGGAEKVVGHPQKAQFNMIIARRRVEVNDIIADLMNRPGGISGMSATELKNTIRDILAPKPVAASKPKENPNTVGKYFTRYVENKGLRERTQSIYLTTWHRIEAWLGKDKAAKLEFSDINFQWLEEFEAFLAKTSSSLNGRRIHHANLKAVINYAIDNEVTDRNPYRRFKIRTQATKKRNMGVEAIRMIIFAKDLEPWMEKYRDFFTLSFMLRGLNTVDLCNLPKPVNGRIDWIRTKTGQPLSLKIEPEMQYLIDKYSGKDLMLNFAEGKNYRRFNDRLTKALHAIVEHINQHRSGGVEVPDCTMYWARHTWASIAHKLDIAMDVIGTGLAHSQHSVTDIYIERDNDKIDTANRRVLDYVLYGKDYRVSTEKNKRGRPKKEVALVGSFA